MCQGTEELTAAAVSFPAATCSTLPPLASKGHAYTHFRRTRRLLPSLSSEEALTVSRGPPLTSYLLLRLLLTHPAVAVPAMTPAMIYAARQRTAAPLKPTYIEDESIPTQPQVKAVNALADRLKRLVVEV